MKKVNGHQIIELLEAFAPKKFAMEGDPIGLQVGNLNRPVKKIMTALDVLEPVVDEAIEHKVDLIIAHHPLIFRPLKRIDANEPAGKIIEKLIKHDIAVYAAHTNLDIAPGGVNDMLAEALTLQNTKVMVPLYEQPLKKLVVFVPEENEKELLQVLGDAGAGAIGDYSHCTFRVKGKGRFLPGNGADPHIGEVGKVEEVDEVRIEAVFPVELQKKILQAMLKAHPYEEPAYDVYPLEVTEETLGLGRVGELPEEMTLEQFASFAKEALDSSGVRVVGNLGDKVKKVAVLGGDGNKYYHHAKRMGADVYVTGDFYYHTAHDAMAAGMNIVDPGHHVEKVMKKGLANVLQSVCGQKGYDVEVFPSEPKTDPFYFI